MRINRVDSRYEREVSRAREAIVRTIPLMDPDSPLLTASVLFAVSGTVDSEVPHQYRGHAVGTRKFALSEATYVLRSVYRSSDLDFELDTAWIVDLEHALAQYHARKPCEPCEPCEP